MKVTKLPFRIPALILVFAAIAGCKLMEDKAEAGLADESAAGSAPSIWGEPETSVQAGTLYYFLPEASDNDGDVLEFSIANQPAWADFDPNSGELQGVPGDDDVGQDSGVVISVTDQNSVVSLPNFSITVDAADVPQDDGGDDGGGAASAPPSITGTPNASVVVDSVYSFRPDASDPEGDALSFSITNKPGWATFNTTRGRLTGTPAGSDIGTSDPIEISVTDGTSIAALSAFTITVEPVGVSSFTLSWSAPTKNDDGTPLADLAGYRIYYGTTSGEYNVTIEVNAGVTNYVIDNLAPGTYFLVMTSVNSEDVESDYTPELSFELGT
jgi:hypothetical protein